MRQQQAWLFLYFVILGAGGGALYDGLRAARRVVRHSVRAVLIEDSIFWTAVLASCYGLFFWKNQGALRGYGFLGVVCGAVLYFLLLSPLIFSVWRFLWKMLLFPIRKLQAGREKIKAKRRIRKAKKMVDESKQIE